MMKQPNVLFLLADQHRWDFLGFEDGVTLTPTLDALAEQGTVLRRAYCPAPLCTPSRAALASGRYPANSGCYTNLHQLPPGSPSFVNQLRQGGYQTAAVGKTHMEIHAYDSDLCSNLHRAFMNSLGYDYVCETAGNHMFTTGIRCAYSQFLEDHGQLHQAAAFFNQWGYFLSEQQNLHTHQSRPWTLPDALHETSFIGQRSRDWLKTCDQDRPFYLHVGFSLPHHPINPLASIIAQYPQAELHRPLGVPEGQVPHWYPSCVKGYRACMTQIDQEIAALRRDLQETGQWENTLIIYTSDHGEMLGDYHAYGKCSFYESSTRVPLIFAGPGIAKGQRSNALVELLDIGKTINTFCHVPAHDLDQGQSLMPLITGQTNTHRETIFCQMGTDQMLFDGRYKLVWGEPGLDDRNLGRLHLDKPVNIAPSPVQLFDLQEDPTEKNNLAHEPHAQNLYTQMLEKLLVRNNQNRQTQPPQDRGTYRPLPPKAPPGRSPASSLI